MGSLMVTRSEIGRVAPGARRGEDLMAQAAQKITLSSSRDIPFDKLVLSQSNVRRIKAGVSVDELAEDIARRGLLQGLSVRPVLDADGVETDKFEIPAGGRRFQALSLLVKQKRLAKTAPVPCVLRDVTSDILAEDDSLAENMQRIALHSLDQFRAFIALREKGQGEEAIAAAFFMTPQIVKQRLKLASMAPAILDVYAEDGMTLEQLMAFTVNPDHVRQVQVWEAVKNSWNKEPYYIWRMLTETSVRASDRRAVFVGVEAASGVVLRDLFQGDDGGWLEGPTLLDRLVEDKPQVEAQAIAAEGWKWIEMSTDLPYGYSHGLRRLVGDPSPPSADEAAEHAKLFAEYRALEEEYSGQDEYPEEIDTRLGELEAAMEALEQQPLIFDVAEVGRAGVFVTLDRDGNLAVYRGYVRPDDEPREETVTNFGDELGVEGQGTDGDVSAHQQSAGTSAATVITSGGQSFSAALPDDEDGGALKPLPERLVMELTAHCTLALREAIGRSPDVALTLLLMKLVNDTFRSFGASGSCLEAYVRTVYMSAQALDQARRLALLAHCPSFGINALHEKVNPYVAGITASGLAQSEIVAQAVDLDMVAAGWEPTVDNYLNRVPKAHTLEAVREAKGRAPHSCSTI
jgi:ParB family chromosome partitioning protein